LLLLFAEEIIMRKYREGRVFLRGRIWWFEAWHHGERITRSSGSIKRSEAVKALNRLKADVVKNRPVGRDVERTRFADLERIATEDYRINARKSLVRLGFSFDRLRAFFGDYKAADITGAALSEYITYRLDQKAAAATINRELAALRRAMRIGRRHGIVADVPEFSLLVENNTRRGFLERSQFEAVRDNLPDYVKPIVVVAYHTGWRIASELLTRERRHVDLSSGWLRLDPGETKNNEGREFPIPRAGELRRTLEEQLARTEAFEKATGQVVPWLFHRDGETIQGFRHAWRKACKLAGLGERGRLPHDFRRTAVRNLERAGIPRSAAMKMVGHRTQSIYSRYAIADAGMLRDAGEKLAAFNEGEQANAKPKVLPITRAYASRP
jgi:site-specific recombinase XerD